MKTIRGTNVPAVGLGTFELNGQECIETVRTALALGYRHFDTASRYGNEADVGVGLEGSGLSREDVFITTKIWITDLEASNAISAVTESLKKLHVDYVDLLLLHWPSPYFSIKESIESLSLVKSMGMTKQIGVSNFPPTLLRQSMSYGEIFSNQVEFHPYLNQGKLLEMTQREDLLLTGYAPLALGRVSEDLILQEIGTRYGKTGAQVALRWLVDHPNVAIVPKSRSVDRLRQNIDLWGYDLSEDENKSIAHLARGMRIYDESWVEDWEDDSRSSGFVPRSVTIT
jgi:diketogulonate reductase-like aldo/keto reductase